MLTVNNVSESIASAYKIKIYFNTFMYKIKRKFSYMKVDINIQKRFDKNIMTKNSLYKETI